MRITSLLPEFCFFFFFFILFFQAEDGMRDLVRSLGLGDVYKRQEFGRGRPADDRRHRRGEERHPDWKPNEPAENFAPNVHPCLLYTTDAADERSRVDPGGRRIIKKKNSEAQ